MKSQLRKIYSYFVMFGFDPVKTIHMMKGLRPYFRDLKILKSQKASAVKEFPFGKFTPCLDDRFSDSGVAKGHYFHQDLLVARMDGDDIAHPERLEKQYRP